MKLNGFQIKLIALVFMILDHVNKTFYGVLPAWVEFLPRFVAPLFVYLMIEGFFHTRSRKKYQIRLYAAAAVMLCGNVIINFFTHTTDPMTGKMTFFSLMSGNNIFMTLAVLFSIVWLLDSMRRTKKLAAAKGLLTLGLMAACLVCEGGIYLLPMALIMFLCKNKARLQYVLILLFCGILLAKAIFSYAGMTDIYSSLYQYLTFDSQFMMAAVIPFMMLYDGTRGYNGRFAKDLFYIIYPAHLWLLMIIGNTLV
ncbi:TraX family protein [Hominibacterium faecale]|uniref:TraX family protein n=1 Tax=Hominibacterium faecale TaxID=2839743 RepID=UPI0022B2A44C|nr:TraX family protein [Hominibacterium faecale]